MRHSHMLGVVMVWAAWLTGCSTKSPAVAPVTAPPVDSPLIVTPDLEVSGRVVLVKADARYVIVSFPIGALPVAGRRLQVYRNGLKVGEIVTSEMQLDFKVVADIVAGSCFVGDEVREN